MMDEQGEIGERASSNPYSTRSSQRSIRILPRRRNSSRASPDWVVFELRVSLLVTKRGEREREREELCVSVEEKSQKKMSRFLPLELSIAAVLGMGCRVYEFDVRSWMLKE